MALGIPTSDPRVTTQGGNFQDIFAPPQQPTPYRAPQTAQERFAYKNTGAPGQAQRQASAAQAAYGPQAQQYNALNYFANIAGFDPNTGTTALGQDFIDRSTGRQQQILSNRDYLSRLLQEDTATNRAKLGLGQKNLGIERGAAERQFGLIDKLLANTMGGFDIQDALSKMGFETGTRQRTSQSVSQGSVGSLGQRRDQADLQGKYFLDVRGTQLGRERATTTAEEDRAKTRDRLAALDLKSQEYGLDAKSLETELARGLQKLNIDAYMSVDDLMDKINSTKAEDRMIADQIINNALQYSSVFPTTVGAPSRSGTSNQGLFASRRR